MHQILDQFVNELMRAPAWSCWGGMSFLFSSDLYIGSKLAVQGHGWVHKSSKQSIAEYIP